MISVRPAAIPAPIQAARSARSRRPAPMFVPTMATSGPPSPNTRGIRRYSRREPVPIARDRRGPEAADESRRDRDREIRLDGDQGSHCAHSQNVAEERPPEADVSEGETDDAAPGAKIRDQRDASGGIE